MTTPHKNDEYNLTAHNILNTMSLSDVHATTQSYASRSKKEAKRPRAISQPEGTVPYTVSNNDTLEKVANHFNATPSELVKLNKLNTRMLYPGQILFVPKQNPLNDSFQSSASIIKDVTLPSISSPKADADSTTSEKTNSVSNETVLQHQIEKGINAIVLPIIRNTLYTTRPGHAERLSMNSSLDWNTSPTTTNKSETFDYEQAQRFVKIHARSITENHECVSGTLIVTPNTIMFDPNVLDPLVKEFGISKYELVIGMDSLSSVGLYEDIALYDHEATSNEEDKRRHCYSQSIQESHERLKASITIDDDEKQTHELMLWLLDKIDKELNPSASSSASCILFDGTPAANTCLSIHSSGDCINQKERLPISIDNDSFEDSFQSANDVFEPLDEYKHSIGLLLQADDNNNGSIVNKVYQRIPSQGYLLENQVSVTKYTKRFNEIDELLRKQHENYHSPYHIEIPHFLCLQARVHAHHKPSVSTKQANKHHRHAKQSDFQEYWFSIPKEKTESLHSFFLHWTPENAIDPLTDDDNNSSKVKQSKSNDKAYHKFFALLREDHSTAPESITQGKHHHYLSRRDSMFKDWECHIKRMNLNMLRILSKTSSSPPCSSKEPQLSPTITRARRTTFHALAARLSDSKKTILEQIPHHQQQLVRLKKRARSFLTSALRDDSTDTHSSTPSTPQTSPGFVDFDEIYERIYPTHSEDQHEPDFGIAPPRLLQKSLLIDEEKSKQILLELPARLHAHDWQLIFSTEIHGFSLSHLYRQASEIDHDSPTLIIVKDVEQNIFGAFASHQLTISSRFYGTGESFLFTFHPEFKVFNWSHSNEYFVKGDLNSIGFGTGDGAYGLWLDDSLYRGRSCATKTFNNERLTSKEDFFIACIEVWTFVD